MADSPDDLLARARRLLQSWRDGYGELEAAAETYADLDALLSAGGPLPADWADCDVPARPMTDVPLTDQISIKIIEDDRMPPGTAAMVSADGRIVPIVGLGGAPEPDDLDWNSPEDAVYDAAPGETAELSFTGATSSLVCELAFRLADKDAEIHRLTSELDATRNAPVEYVITAGLEAAMAADPHREDGAVIRTTDGKREAWAWKAATKEWEQIH